MFIDPDLRAMILFRFELVGNEITPGVPDTTAGRAAVRSSALRELIRLVYDQVKFSAEGSDAERSSLALVVDEAENHWQRMHAAALHSSAQSIRADHEVVLISGRPFAGRVCRGDSYQSGHNTR